MTEIFFFFFSTPEFVMDGHSLGGLPPSLPSGEQLFCRQ